MKNKYWFQALLLILCVACIAFIYGCGANPTSGGGGSSGGNRAGTFVYSGTQSPGDVWSWIISTETFIGSNETTGMWVKGSWVTLVTGFGKATITSAEGPSAPPGDGSAHAYFLEFPNTMLLVKPDDDNDSRVMVCAAAATIEPNAGRYLFVNIPESGWDIGSPSYGTVEAINNSDGTFSFAVTNYTITNEVFSSNPPTRFIWSNGSFTIEATGTDSTEVFMTPSGVFFGDSGPDRGGFAGASIESITTSELYATVFPHTFKGVRFIYYPGSSTGETEPITCTKDSTRDALLASSYIDVETGTQPGPGVSITFEVSTVPGFFTGYATQLNPSSPGTERFVSSVSQIGPASGKKYMLYGIGSTQDGRPWNFLLIQTSND